MKLMMILTVLFCSFLFNNKVFASPRYDKMAHRMMSDYTKTLKTTKGLYLSCAGGSMMDDIQNLTLRYISFERLSVEEARKLYVEVVEGFLQKVNQNEKIRPYLHDYPFTVLNLTIMIGFVDENRKELGGGYVALMFIGRNNEICYEGYDHVKDDYYSLYREPYEEALKIVRANGCAETSN